MLTTIVAYAPLVVAPFILMLFSFVSAYVMRFRLPRSGLAFDYVLFTLLMVVALMLGGAI